MAPKSENRTINEKVTKKTRNKSYHRKTALRTYYLEMFLLFTLINFASTKYLCAFLSVCNHCSVFVCLCVRLSVYLSVCVVFWALLPEI